METDISEVTKNIRASFDDIEFDPKNCDAYLIAIQDRAERLRLIERNLGIQGIVSELVAKAIQQINLYLDDYPNIDSLWPVLNTRSELFYIDDSVDLLLEDPRFAEALGDVAWVHGDYESADKYYSDAISGFANAAQNDRNIESESRCRDKRRLAFFLEKKALKDDFRLTNKPRPATYILDLDEMPPFRTEEIDGITKVANYLNRISTYKRTPLNTALSCYRAAWKSTSLVSKPPITL